MTKAEIIEWLREKLNPELFRHSIGTQEMAGRLADIYKVDREKATFAGLLHDCAKEMSNEDLISLAKRYGIWLDEIRLAQPGLLHAPVGAKLARQVFGVADDEVLHAIEVHNTGCMGMSSLDKVLYLADASEPNRKYPGVDWVRNLVSSGDLDGSVLGIMDMKIRHVLEGKRLLHPMSLEARNDVLRVLETMGVERGV